MENFKVNEKVNYEELDKVDNWNSQYFDRDIIRVAKEDEEYRSKFRRIIVASLNSNQDYMYIPALSFILRAVLDSVESEQEAFEKFFELFEIWQKEYRKSQFLDILLAAKTELNSCLPQLASFLDSQDIQLEIFGFTYLITLFTHNSNQALASSVINQIPTSGLSILPSILINQLRLAESKIIQMTLEELLMFLTQRLCL